MGGLIRFAVPEDVPQLKMLWQDAFEDTPQGTLFYFARRHRADNMLVYEQEDKPLGMLTMLPMQLRMGDVSLPARYIFAVATDKAARGRGISTKLLDAAHQHMLESGDAAAVLAPAEPSLFAFYQKRGYQTVFYADHAVVEAAQLPPYAGQCRDITKEEYQALRDAAFDSSRLFVRFDGEALAYIMASARLYGGRVLYAEDGDMKGAALCEWLDDDTVRITDMALLGMMPLHFLAAVQRELKAKCYHLRVQEGLWPVAERLPLGMLHPLQPLPQTEGTPPYLALIKD